jgi:phytoene dehydrogenase-like protein
MSNNSVIIIGAGLAGLSAGCFAQMNGYQSHIFEHHSQPGGVAAAWRRGDYFIDGGIHFVMGHRPGTALHALYRTLGVIPSTRFTDLGTYGRFTHEASGRSVVLTADLGQVSEALNSLSPADAAIVDELVAGTRGMQGIDMSAMGLSSPPELSSPWTTLKEMWAMRPLLKYLVGKYNRPVADYARDVKDPVLRRCIEHLFLPEVPVYFIFMVLAMLADGQLGLIDGTCLDFVRAIEKRYLELGGQVTYRATVDQILVENDRAVGVRLADGSQHHAGAVIAACDGRSVIFDMLGGQYVNAKIEERYATWPTFRPQMMISYGVAREFSGEPPFGTIQLENPLSLGEQTVSGFMTRIFNYSRRFAPPGKTVVQVEFDTEWDYWNNLQQQDRAAYDAEKERMAAEVLQRLEAHYPDISSLVEVTDVATPYTTWRYTLNHEAAWEGWLMTPEAMRTTIERTLPGLDDLIMAGQWVIPGGGVPFCLYSGNHAVQLLCHRDRKPFSPDPKT